MQETCLHTLPIDLILSWALCHKINLTTTFSIFLCKVKKKMKQCWKYMRITKIINTDILLKIL